MAQLTIDLPADMEAKLRTRCAGAGYADAQEYVRDLIAVDIRILDIEPPDRVVVRSQEELERKLLASFNSGPAIERSDADREDLRRRLIEKHSNRTAT